MRQRMSSGRITALCVLLCLAFRVASRVSSVAYASAATDVLYMDGILPTVLYVLRQVFLAIAAGVSVAGVVLSAFAGTRRIRLATAWLFCLIPFADAAAAFLIDVCSGAVSGGTAVLALILNTATFLMVT